MYMCMLYMYIALAFLSAPHEHLHFPCTHHSLGGNGIKYEGCMAVAAVLPETKLTSLEYAAAPLSACFSVFSAL